MGDTDPLALLARLTPDAIRARLDELHREERALRTLLRSSVYRHAGRPDATAPRDDRREGGERCRE